MNKKIVAMMTAMVVLFGMVVGGTIAWLTDSEAPVVNTFVAGNIDIELDEAPLKADGKTIDTTVERVKVNTSYKLLPGNTLQKDPEVRVLDESEACWLFIKIEESTDFLTYMTYSVVDDWTPLNDEDGDGIADDGVYYQEVDSLVSRDDNTDVDDANAEEFQILTDNKVVVKNDLTKQQLDAITVNPTLTITAYAVQKDNVATAADAWEILFPTPVTP